MAHHEEDVYKHLLFCTCCLRIRVLCCDFAENGFSSQHATLHSCVGAFDLWDVHETRATAYQQPPGESQLWDRLERKRKELMPIFNFPAFCFLSL